MSSFQSLIKYLQSRTVVEVSMIITECKVQIRREVMLNVGEGSQWETEPS